MNYEIGSARIDERGKASGGAAGDQKQIGKPDYRGEVSMQSFYVHSKGWIVARLIDPEEAEKAADAMVTACNNPNIGYDQNQRNGLWKVGTDTKVKKETDCSALVRECIYEATGKDVGDIRTILMESYLKKSGLFMELKQYKSGMKLYRGDVLFTGYLGHPISGHTVIVTKGYNRKQIVKVEPQIAEPTLRRGDKNPQVKVLQKNLNKMKLWGPNRPKLIIDGDFGPKTEEMLRAFQKKYGIQFDGIYGPESRDTMKKAYEALRPGAQKTT